MEGFGFRGVSGSKMDERCAGILCVGWSNWGLGDGGELDGRVLRCGIWEGEIRDLMDD